MRRWLLLLLALAGAPAAAAGVEPVEVAVSRQGEAFVAEFAFPRSAPAWGFFRSSVAAADGQPWRARSWKVLTPGVALERRGKQDALVAENGSTVPRKVKVLVTPFTGDLDADYVPALSLGGEGVALFDGHFSAYSVDRAEVLDTLPAAFDPAFVGDGGTRIRFAGENLRLAGDVAGYERGQSAGTYGLFGVANALVENGVATVIDGDLPAWIAKDLAAFTPDVMAAMSAGLGSADVPQPTILAAWEGGARDGASMNGGTLNGLIITRFEGKDALEANPALSDLAHWFIAHEAAHFWLGQTVMHESARDGWISEGGADLLAVRAVERLNPGFDPRRKLNSALRDCAKLADEPVASAVERGEHRAYYACGAVFSLVAEKIHGGDAFAFTRKLIDANRADGKVSAADWFTALGDPALAAPMRALVEQGSPDPKAALTALLTQAGIAFAANADGVPQLP